MGRDHLHDDTSVDRRSSLRHRLALQGVPWLGLVVIWIALWGDVSVANIVGGALVATAVVALFHPGRRERLGRFRPVAATRFLGHALASLVHSTGAVAWEVLTPTDRTRPGILAVPLPSATPVVLTAVTMVVGMTPGTVVVEVHHAPTVLYVHVLHLHDPAAIRRQIGRLEARALAAFGPPDADDDIVALEERGTDR